MDKTEWRLRLEKTIATLQSLTPSEFFDDQTLRYHGVEDDLNALSQAFKLDREKLAPVLATKPVGRACWLPLDPREILSMDVAQVYWRLGENLADERFVDGAFETGWTCWLFVPASPLSVLVGPFR
jgi:hypothetical protein